MDATAVELVDAGHASFKDGELTNACRQPSLALREG
jgi:hypothetical protein